MNFTKEQIDILKELEKKYPNNMEYGSSIRYKYMDEDFTRAIPNDQDLGKEIRRIIKNN
jgi:hypothetical protein